MARTLARTQRRVARSVRRHRSRRVVPDGRHRSAARPARARAGARDRRPARSADRFERGPSRPRAHVGLAGHDARGAVPARAHGRGAIRRVLSSHGAQAARTARLVRGTCMQLLDAGSLRHAEHLPRRRARLRRDGVGAVARPRAARRRMARP